MLRGLIFVFNGVLLGLASGLVSQSQEIASSPIHEEKMGDFYQSRYALGDFSDLIVASLSGVNLDIEGQGQAWNCDLEFGTPAENYVQWIHSVDLICERDSEVVIFPLGEGEFRKAYAKGRLLIKGAAAETLSSVLERNSNDSSVESAVSSRTIAWGPQRQMEIFTLRRSSIEANLKFSLECYRDLQSEELHSCALAF